MSHSRGRAALRALTGLVLGLTVGVALSTSESPAAGAILRDIEPLGVMWVNAIRMTVIPLVVASLIIAVSGTAPGTVGRLGVRVFLIFTALLAVIAAITAVVAPWLFERLAIDPAAAESIRAGVPAIQRPELPSFSAWLIGIVPTNPIKAAADGAMLPLVGFSLAFGLALGRLDEPRREFVVAFFRGIAEAMTLLVSWVLSLAPVGVFLLALVLAAKLGAGVVGAVGFYILVHSGLLLLATALLYVAVILFARVAVRDFARAALPGQLVAVTTRSSMAALPALLTSADATLRLPNTVTSFALPLATSTFRLNQAVTWVVVTLFAAKLYGIGIGPGVIATIAATSVLMSFSVPGIPSASLFMIAPFLATVGIPPESIGVLIAIDLIPDVFKTLLNVTGHLASVTLLAGREELPPVLSP
ncbi:MAG: dicarboxylate/amino acid:cation symporter [Gemmatimonadota bacterium]